MQDNDTTPLRTKGKPLQPADSLAVAESTKTARRVPAFRVPSVDEMSQLKAALNALNSNPGEAAVLAEKLLSSPPKIPWPDSFVCKALWIQGVGLAISEQHRKALSVLKEAEALARKFGDDKQLRQVLRYKSASALECAEYNVGRDAALEAIKISESFEDSTAYVARLYNELAGNESALGNKQSAIECLLKADEISERCDDQIGRTQWLVNAAGLMAELQQYEQAIESYQRILKIQGNDVRNMVSLAAHAGLGDCLVETKKFKLAKQHLQLALEMCEMPGTDHLRGGVELSLGIMHVGMHEHQTAKQHLMAAMEIFEKLEQPAELAQVRHALRILEPSDDVDERIRNIRGDLARAVESGDIELQISLHRELADLLTKIQRWKPASSHSRLASKLEEELAKHRTDAAFAKAFSELGQREMQMLIDSLESEASARSQLVVAHRRWNIGLVVCVCVLVVVVLVIGGLLSKYFRALQDVKAANENLRLQKVLQSKMERRLAERQKSESLAQMASGIAHDFNNLLAGIAGLAELAAVSNPVNRKDQLLGQIKDASLQASGLTGQLMQFLGNPRMDSTGCDMVHVARSTEALLQSVARPNLLQMSVSDGACFAGIDDTRLRQVLVNLVANAAEASDSDGRIVLSIDTVYMDRPNIARLTDDQELTAGDYCRIQVVDNGSGMTSDTRSRLFDPYFSTKSMGRGLGLSSVIGIVRSCGGFVEVESEAGKGCCFTIYFKSISELAVCKAIDGPAELKLPRNCDADEQKTVLIVDDERILLEMQAEYLQLAGFRILTADSAEQGLSIAQRHMSEIDCLVTDFCMRGKNGMWLAEQLKTASPGLPVILCTGFADGSLKSGETISRVLSKPYSPRTLVEIIRECISTKDVVRIAESDARSLAPCHFTRKAIVDSN